MDEVGMGESTFHTVLPLKKKKNVFHFSVILLLLFFI